MGETTFNPNVAIHPGKTLQETLEAVGMSQAELAERTGLTPKTINEIVQGKSSVTPETAIKLSAVFGMSVAFWNNLQRNYQETLARLEVEKKLSHELVNLRKFFCYVELAKWGYVKKTNVDQEKIMNLLNFFGVSSLNLVPKIQAAAFRKSNQKNLSHESLAAWLRCGELEAQKIQTREFDKNKLIDSLAELRGLTRQNPAVFEHKMVELCASFGVAVVFVPYFKNTFVNGATRWVNDKAIVQLSLRGNYSDIFWFTFFHELAHVFKHGKTDQFVEFEDGKHLDSIEKEKEADEFATNTLIPRNEYANFRQKNDFSYGSVTNFANAINISQGIVAGRLSHDYSDWKQWARIRNRLKFVEKEQK
mgnify:CR=1 FL=1